MKSFIFWLTTAAALGAILGTAVRPGAVEVVVAWAVFTGLFYALRGGRVPKISANLSHWDTIVGAQQNRKR